MQNFETYRLALEHRLEEKTGSPQELSTVTLRYLPMSGKKTKASKNKSRIDPHGNSRKNTWTQKKIEKKQMELSPWMEPPTNMSGIQKFQFPLIKSKIKQNKAKKQKQNNIQKCTKKEPFDHLRIFCVFLFLFVFYCYAMPIRRCARAQARIVVVFAYV